MTKAETIAGVYTHTSNLVKNKQAKKLATMLQKAYNDGFDDGSY